MNTSSFAAVIFAKALYILKWLNNSPLHLIHLVRVYSVEILLSGIYSRAANVGKQKRCIIDRFTSTSLPDTACIYQACIMQVKHNIKNEHFHPRWLPKQIKTEQSCCIEYCKNPVYRNTNLISHEEVAKVGVHSRKQLCTGTPLPEPLQ